MRRPLLVYVVTAASAMLVVLACEPWWPTTNFICKPSSSDPEGRCPDSFLCCSNDASALDPHSLDTDALPQFGVENTLGNTGTPLFAATANDASEWGLCVHENSVAPAYALPGGCPIPCNPTWDRTDIDRVCGEGIHCCQSAELEPEDCVFDPDLAGDGCWRPIRGTDIDGLGGLDATDWSTNAHATHQDPNGVACQAFVAEHPDVDSQQLLRACLSRLGAADTRGFCIGGPGVTGCPLAQPGYRDACEQLNDAEGRSDCD